METNCLGLGFRAGACIWRLRVGGFRIWVWSLGRNLQPKTLFRVLCLGCRDLGWGA